MKARLYWLFCAVLLVVASCSLPFSATADDAPSDATVKDRSGKVSLGLSQYDKLVDASRQPVKTPRVPPSGYALGQAQVKVRVNEADKRAFAKVEVDLGIKVLDDDWVLVPILPVGTAVREVTVNSNAVELISSAQGLSWGVKGSGSYTMRIAYDVDAQRFDAGYALSVPMPTAASASLSASIPGNGIDVSVIPSSGLKTSIIEQTKSTDVTATIPATSGMQISWRVPRTEGHTISRALYVGELINDAVMWKATFDVELFNDETLTIPLLSQSITLREIQVDGARSNIVVENGSFATLVKTRGAHKIDVSFQVPLNKQEGPHSVSFAIPEIPVSQFELSLRGKKEIKVSPVSNVVTEFKGETTQARVFVPMTSNVSFTWSEALPEEIKEEVRVNASIFHTAHAQEGVLYMQAVAQYEITRGKIRSIELLVPQDVQINKVDALHNIVADWRVNKEPIKNNAMQVLTVFLDREMESDFEINVYYDRSIVNKQDKERIDVPLLSAVGVNRQRGMVALLATKELTLKPIEEVRVTKVGENQLPPFIRQNMSMTIAHTYKYVEESPRLIAQATEPEKRQGKFDAVVNTLLSLKDVSIVGTAVCEISVKSGRISNLTLELPKGVNFLNLTGPSIRNHNINVKDTTQEIEINFTQDMEGQFRMEATYERILADSEQKLDVPKLDVQGAEAKTGFIAVEALSAVEIQPAVVEQLSSVQVNELPQQLVLKTTNPILLAYKFVTIPYTLQLSFTRHKVIDVQSATIDKALYRTLIVKDGFAIVTVEFTVRNSQKQFLRVMLPKDATIWSVMVDGKPEKPAIDETKKKLRNIPAKEVLIKVINEARGFPVMLVYQTPIGKLQGTGFIDEVLPRPDMVATNTRWEVYMPADLKYGRLSTNMQEVDTGTFQSEAEINRQMNASLNKNIQVSKVQAIQQQADGDSRYIQEPGAANMNVHVPRAGIRYVFEKLYANQADEDSYFRLFYVSTQGDVVLQILIAIAVVFLCVSIISLLFKDRECRGAECKARALLKYVTLKHFAWSVFVVSFTVIIILLGYLKLDYETAVKIFVLMGVFVIGICCVGQTKMLTFFLGAQDQNKQNMKGVSCDDKSSQLTEGKLDAKDDKTTQS